MVAVIQIPNLPAVVSLNGTEPVEAVQAGASVKITVDQIAAYVAAQYPAPGVSSIATTSPITGGTITTTGTVGLEAAGVTNAFLASMTGGTVKANVTGSPATPADVSVSGVLDVLGTSRGSVLYRGASAWTVLTPGTAGYVLATQGINADPVWALPSGVAFLAQSPLDLTGTTLSFIGNLAVPFRRITAPGPVAMLSTDYEVGIDQTIGATITVALPSAPVAGQRAQVSDVKGDAETFNITVTGAINGGTSYVISTNYGWVVFRYSGTQWNIVG